MDKIQIGSFEALKNLDKKNKEEAISHKEYLEETTALAPRITPSMRELDLIEEQMQNQNRLFEADYIAKQNKLIKQQRQKSLLQNRKVELDLKRDQFKQKIKKQKELLRDSIVDTFNSASLKRRNEFKVMITKCLKIKKDIKNLQEKENFDIRMKEGLFCAYISVL